MVRVWKRAADQRCFYCGSDKTNSDRVRLKNRFKLYPHWKYDENDNTMCTTCYYKKYPTVWKKEWDNDNFLWYGKKVRKYVKRTLTGQCSKCKLWRGHGIQMTDMHHEFYIACLKWFGRIELCASCHCKLPKKMPYSTMIRMKTRKGKRYCIIISQTYKGKNTKRDPKTGRYC